MDKFFHPQRSEAQQQGAFFVTLLKILENAMKLAGWFFQMTEEEQRDAGIYLDRLGDE
jgi:hypothetical protein